MATQPKPAKWKFENIGRDVRDIEYFGGADGKARRMLSLPGFVAPDDDKKPVSAAVIVDNADKDAIDKRHPGLLDKWVADGAIRVDPVY